MYVLPQIAELAMTSSLIIPLNVYTSRQEQLEMVCRFSIFGKKSCQIAIIITNTTLEALEELLKLFTCTVCFTINY